MRAKPSHPRLIFYQKVTNPIYLFTFRTGKMYICLGMRVNTVELRESGSKPVSSGDQISLYMMSKWIRLFNSRILCCKYVQTKEFSSKLVLFGHCLKQDIYKIKYVIQINGMYFYLKLNEMIFSEQVLQSDEQIAKSCSVCLSNTKEVHVQEYKSETGRCLL